MAKAKQSSKQEVEIDGRNLTLSNLDKVLYPESGFTKAQVIDYYRRVSPYLLPHFKARPVTLKRFPDGVDGKVFYEKNAPRFTPAWVKTVPVPRKAGGPDIRYIVIEDLPTLIWSANIASLELHPFLHRAPQLQRPTALVFDLDPGEGRDILGCAEIAFMLRDLLARLSFESLPKVSGSKGLQLYVPLNSPAGYDVTQSFARAIAGLLSKEHPDAIVVGMAKTERKNKVFIDWSQNSDFKTTIGVYSLRAKSGTPFVSLPVTWDELGVAYEARDKSKLYWQASEALERLDKVGDLFNPVLTLRQKLSKSLLARLA